MTTKKNSTIPILNILNVYLRYCIASLERDFGPGTKTIQGQDISLGIALPLKETMTKDEIAKLQKYADILNEPQRYKRIEKKLKDEVGKNISSKPIIFLTEVTRKWAQKMKIFFHREDYQFFFVPGRVPLISH